MLRRHRLSLGLCATVALAWGLVGAPAHHQLVEHKHAPILWQPRSLPLKSGAAKRKAPASRQHGSQHQHFGESLEHGQVALHSAVLPPQKIPVLLFALVEQREARRAPPYRAAWRHTEQPQGP